MWTSETVTAWTFRAGSTVRPPIGNDGVLHDGQAESPESEDHQRQQRFLVAAAIGQAAVRGITVHGPALAAEPGTGPAGAAGRGTAVGLLQEPIRQDQAGAAPLGRGGPPGVVLAGWVLGGVAVLESPESVIRPTGQLQVEDVRLEEVLTAASAGQHGEEGVVVPTTEPLLGVVEREEQVGLGGVLGAVQGDDHLVEAPEEEVDLGPQERLPALLGGGPEDQVGQQLGVGPVPLGQATHRHPLRGLPGGLAQPLGVLEDLGGLVDVLVRDEVVEQRLPPVVARLEDLAGQLLDDRRMAPRSTGSVIAASTRVRRAMPSPWGTTGLYRWRGHSRLT